MSCWNLEKRREWYKKNREKICAYNKARRPLYREKLSKTKKEWYEANKEIVLIRSKAWKKANKDKVKINGRNRWQKMKSRVINHYSNGTMMCACSGCGVSEITFLCIDHINNDGKEERENTNLKGGHHFYAWLIKNNLPDKDRYQVLCLNCNWGRQSCGACPGHYIATKDCLE